jgi:hypothetical protein
VNAIHMGQLVAPPPEMHPCKRCGDTFPLMPGDKAETCHDWVELTLRKMPRPAQFDTFLLLKLFGRLCPISAGLRDELAYAAEVAARG